MGSKLRPSGEMADAQDLKSWVLKQTCRFESDHRHHSEVAQNEWVMRIEGLKCVQNCA